MRSYHCWTFEKILNYVPCPDWMHLKLFFETWMLLERHAGSAERLKISEAKTCIHTASALLRNCLNTSHYMHWTMQP